MPAGNFLGCSQGAVPAAMIAEVMRHCAVQTDAGRAMQLPAGSGGPEWPKLGVVV
jgi:hypothetical protein